MQVLVLKDKYYLLYSANHFRNIDYAVEYAVADSSMGPWKKYSGNPIIHRSIVGEKGSGHGDLVKGSKTGLYEFSVNENKVIVPLQVAND